MRVKYIYLAVCIIVGRALPCTSKVSCQVHKTTTFYYCWGYRKVGATYWSLKCIQYFKKCPAQGILQLSSCSYKGEHRFAEKRKMRPRRIFCFRQKMPEFNGKRKLWMLQKKGQSQGILSQRRELSLPIPLQPFVNLRRSILPSPPFLVINQIYED